MASVSIIVIVYNIKPYLSQCIESLLSQTMKDIEIILVDDGSTDGSGILCDEYAERDNRIRVFHKSNEGLACARNDGIEAATSPYIMFVDGDDWVEKDYVDKSIQMAISYNADMVLFQYRRYDTKGDYVENGFNILPGIICKEDAFSINLLISVAWLGLYRKSLFNDIRFPAGKIYEDVGTIYKLIQKADKICFLNSCLYNYRVGRPGSITTEPDTKYHMDYREMRIARIRDLHKWGYDKLLGKTVFSMIIDYGYKDSDVKLLSVLMKTVLENPPEDLSRKRKILLMIYRVSPALFDIICILSGKRRIYNQHK